MLGSPAGPGAPSQRGFWTSAPISSPTGYTADGFGKYGVYSLFPGSPPIGNALYSHANAFGRFASGQVQFPPGVSFSGSHKVPDSLFSSMGYTFGAPTTPPGSPYSPIPVAQLELLTKGIHSNIIIQQASDLSLSPKKIQITERRCDEKCCNIKQKSCLCPDDLSQTSRGKISNNGTGCSRTNPIEWGNINIKKEPGHPCQVAEISTSISPVIKVELTSPTQKNAGKDVSPIIGSVNESKESMVSCATMGGASGSAILQCTNDRTALANWQIGGSQNSSLATPTVWPYPAPVPMESIVPLPVPMPPVGFQLVRDPTTGGLLLLPTTANLESIQQAVVWPSYSQQSPLILPPMAPPPLQLLSSSSSDYLSSSATFQQQTQTQSTRLLAVATDAKRKLHLPPSTLIKIEADASSLDQSKTISTISNDAGAVFTDPTIPPLVTTHVIYQHAPNIVLSQSSAVDSSCKSQVPSPLPCQTVLPEMCSQVEEPPLAVDASNQTDTPVCSEDDATSQTLPEVNQDSDSVAIIDGQYSFSEEKSLEESSETIFHNQDTEIKSPTGFASEKDELRLKKQDAKESIEHIKENTEEQVYQPDLTGLELLSNSIMEFESCQNNIKYKISINVEDEQDEIVETNEKKDQGNSQKSSKDKLGGLDLLCVLAEQRIREETVKSIIPKVKSKMSKKKKRKSKRCSDGTRYKKHKSDRRSNGERCKRDIDLEIERCVTEGNESDNCSENKCTCQLENYKSYHTPQSEKIVRKYIQSKSQSSCCQADWPCMNAMELDMRMRLADLQRQYREKQKELNKLDSKRRYHHHHHHHHHSGCSKKHSRIKSHSSCNNAPLPPETPANISPVEMNRDELLEAPQLIDEQDQSPKFWNPKKFKNTQEKCANLSLEKVALGRNEETCRTKIQNETEIKHTSYEKKERKSSSKKRKVGRPKKISELYIPTETIVAKKPKTGSFVGYLIAAKERLKMKQSLSDSPPRFIDDSSVYIENKNNNNNNLAREPKLTKELYADDETEWEIESKRDSNSYKITEDIKQDSETNIEENESIEREVRDETINSDEGVANMCSLTSAHLEIGNLRVLTVMAGLFYAGQLHALQPPDVYSITLDGERGNRPHIMSREEILRDAIIEIAPKSTEELEAGTRVCAYWSQQYRCLYPGTIAEPNTSNSEVDRKFLSVEFDDGDSGTIALEDIRLLPENYPVMEYDPNPLLSLTKRKRRTSSSITVGKEMRQSFSQEQENTAPSNRVENIALEEDAYKERKRLKKMKKKKFKSLDKVKKKKHRCTEEECRHKRHHKKHKKHKRYHMDTEITSTVIKNTENTENEALLQENCAETDTVLINEQDNLNVEDISRESTEFSEMETDDKDKDYKPNPDDEVTIDDILEVIPKKKKIRNRQASCESSKSKMSAFLPAKQFWSWLGKWYKRTGKGPKRREFYRTIQRGKEYISVGDSAVFLSTARPDRPYIGHIETMWEEQSKMEVRIKWFYHPEETIGCPDNLKYPGALFESSHYDKNDVQTISHKCEVLPLNQYLETLEDDPQRYAAIYENNDIYYLAGSYDPIKTILRLKNDIPLTPAQNQTAITIGE